MATVTGKPRERAPSEFESRAHALVGRLVMVYSRLDVNLALMVASWRGNERRAETLLQLENTSFRSKLNKVLDTVMLEYPPEHACIAEWHHWLDDADRLRCKRNDLMHGRWGIDERGQRVVNVLGLPGSPNQREIAYTLSELADEVERAEGVSAALWRLREKWPC